ncbi:hypothetical protein BGX29_007699 [Mortierella sp. GBA35]|nr:hypothetical protein BGX29_007699 [Mortierella sp. GBA35]
MDPIITSFTSTDNNNSSNGSREEVETPGSATSLHYKKVHIPLAYPSEAVQQSTTKAYVYPPLMSPSDDDFYKSALPQPFPPPSSNTINSSSISFLTQPINIPSSNRSRERESGQFGGRPLRSSASFTAGAGGVRRGSMSAMSSPSVPASMPGPMPSPPASPWKRSTSLTRPSRSATMLIVDETPYPDLPAEVRAWSSSHVAEYLGYSLRRYPRAITEDLGRYVRQTACLNGTQFLDLCEEDLERMQINLKWRSMIMKAVGMLRRETLRASRVVSMNWEDGYDPEKDGSIASPTPSSPTHSDEEDRSIPHSASATTSSDATHSKENSQSHRQTHDHHSAVHTTTTTTTSSSANTNAMENTKVHQQEHQSIDAQELRRGIVEDISSILLSWKKDQEAALAKKIAAEASSRGGLGFMEGVVIGGLVVAFMMRFAR